MLKLAQKIYKMTAALKMTGQPDLAEREIDAYATLIETREPLLNELLLLIENNRGDDNKVKEVTKILKDIFALDQENIRIAEHMRTSVMGSMKDAKSDRKLKTAYAHPYETESSGLLDTKQ